MNFEKAESYLESFINYEQSMKMKYDQQAFDLGRIRNFLRDFGVDFQKLNFIHVGGSKGKGTICNLLDRYLDGVGFRVGLYTSPHMLQVTERFSINVKDISEQQFADYVAELKKFIDKNGGTDLTYFELLTVLAFKFFLDQGVDYVVLEVGMGGRLDATNVVLPLLSIISKVEMEHSDMLGDTLEKIIEEKLGIMKPGVPLLVGKQSPRGQAVFEQKLLGREQVYFAEELVLLEGIDLAKSENGQLVFQALKILFGEVDGDLFQRIFDKFQIVGRLDFRQIEGKTVVFDMAHTTSSIENLISALPKKKLIFLVSILRGKDVKGILDLIFQVAGEVVFCSCHPQRGLTGDQLQSIAGRGEVVEDPEKAYEKLFSELKRDQVLVVTGSHFLVAKILAMLP